MEKIIWRTEKRKVSELIPATYNPRKISEKEREDLMASIKEFSEVEPVVINLNNRMIGGHQRISIYADLAVDEIDVRVPNRLLTDEEEKRLNLRLNKNVASWDFEKLEDNFSIDTLLDIGFGDEELSSMFDTGEISEDNFDEEFEYTKIAEPTTKLGDFFQLGDNKLLCGSAIKKEDVDKLMGGTLADMVFTDPPFGVNYKGTKFDVIKGDNETEEDFIKFSEEFVSRIKEALKEGGVYYICSGYASYVPFLYAIKSNGLKFSAPIIWVKNLVSFRSFADYKTKQEMLLRGRKIKKKGAQPIMYGWNNGKHFWVDDPKEADVWEIKRRASNTMVHPTQKPLELVGRAIRNSSKIGETILDLFGGSGSTLICAERESRKCLMMELDEKYCDVIINRWENFTGKKAIKL